MSDEPKYHICSICQIDYVGFGNNAEPINNGRCCDYCNGLVITARMRIVARSTQPKPRRKDTNADNH